MILVPFSTPTTHWLSPTRPARAVAQAVIFASLTTLRSANFAPPIFTCTPWRAKPSLLVKVLAQKDGKV